VYGGNCCWLHQHKLLGFVSKAWDFESAVSKAMHCAPMHHNSWCCYAEAPTAKPSALATFHKNDSMAGFIFRARICSNDTPPSVPNVFKVSTSVLVFMASAFTTCCADAEASAAAATNVVATSLWYLPSWNAAARHTTHTTYAPARAPCSSDTVEPRHAHTTTVYARFACSVMWMERAGTATLNTTNKGCEGREKKHGCSCTSRRHSTRHTQHNQTLRRCTCSGHARSMNTSYRSVFDRNSGDVTPQQ